jgi:PqqD family protein of HPr-rel-A system
VSTDTGGEFVILGLESGRYHGLAEVAARIWALVQEGTTVAEIEARVGEEYDVDPERARSDVQRFLADLRGRGLLDVDEVDSA